MILFRVGETVGKEIDRLVLIVPLKCVIRYQTTIHYTVLVTHTTNNMDKQRLFCNEKINK